MANRGMRGTKDRVERVNQSKTGQSSTVSSDSQFPASRLYKPSEKEAQASEDGKSSKMVFAGIPLLPSSLTSLIIECERIGAVTLLRLSHWNRCPKCWARGTVCPEDCSMNSNASAKFETKSSIPCYFRRALPIAGQNTCVALRTRRSR